MGLGCMVFFDVKCSGEATHRPRRGDIGTARARFAPVRAWTRQGSVDAGDIYFLLDGGVTAC